MDDIEVVPSSVKPVTVVFEDVLVGQHFGRLGHKLEAYKDNWAVFDGRVYASTSAQFGTGSTRQASRRML